MARMKRLITDPRLAIIDWSMTGLEGVEICRRIRADAGLNYVYMIILTSRTRSEDLMDAMEAGADDCIAKPFCSQELRARLLAGFRIIRLQERLISADFCSPVLHDDAGPHRIPLGKRRHPIDTDRAL